MENRLSGVHAVSPPGERVPPHSVTHAARLIDARERYVPRGISTSPLVVARAEGARIWDADGHEYLDFADRKSVV